MTKKTKIIISITAILSIIVIVGLSVYLSMFCRIGSDDVSVKQLQTLVGKRCIVPELTDRYTVEGAEINFVIANENSRHTEIIPNNYKIFSVTFERNAESSLTVDDGDEYSYLLHGRNGFLNVPLTLNNTFTYKNKGINPKAREYTCALSYNRLGYNTYSNGYKIKMCREPLEGEKYFSNVRIGVRKPSEAIRNGSGTARFYTFGEMEKFEGVDIYYAYGQMPEISNKRETVAELALCFAKDNVVYCIDVECFQDDISSSDLKSPKDYARECAIELLKLYLK